MDPEISAPERLALYRTMVRIRAFENAAEAASQGGVSAYGQEAGGRRQGARPAAPVDRPGGGAGRRLRPPARATTTSPPPIAATATRWPRAPTCGRMMAELFGKASGFNGGKGGSMHIADFSVGMLGANGVVAAGLPIAVGAAHAQKLQRRRRSRSASSATARSTAGPSSSRSTGPRVYGAAGAVRLRGQPLERDHRQRPDDRAATARPARAAAMDMPGDRRSTATT